MEEEAEVIRYIAKRYMEGLGFIRIARELNEKEIKSPSGQEWHYTGVRAVLTNEKNAGDMILQKRFVLIKFINMKKTPIFV